MEKAKMSFVRFDAADVIATSGILPPVPPTPTEDTYKFYGWGADQADPWPAGAGQLYVSKNGGARQAAFTLFDGEISFVNTKRGWRSIAVLDGTIMEGTLKNWYGVSDDVEYTMGTTTVLGITNYWFSPKQ